MTTEEIKKIVLKWCEKHTGLTFIFENQDKPRPALPYGALLFTGNGARVGGIDELRFNRDNEKFYSEGTRLAPLTLDIIGVGANEKLSSLRDKIDWPESVEYFEKYNLALQTEEVPQDLSALEDTKTRERARLVCSLAYSISNETSTSTIETVEIETTVIKNNGGQPVIENDINEITLTEE
jgi:hypothetical protein